MHCDRHPRRSPGIVPASREPGLEAIDRRLEPHLRARWSSIPAPTRSSSARQCSRPRTVPGHGSDRVRAPGLATTSDGRSSVDATQPDDADPNPRARRGSPLGARDEPCDCASSGALGLASTISIRLNRSASATKATHRPMTMPSTSPAKVMASVIGTTMPRTVRSRRRRRTMRRSWRRTSPGKRTKPPSGLAPVSRRRGTTSGPARGASAVRSMACRRPCTGPGRGAGTPVSRRGGAKRGNGHDGGRTLDPGVHLPSPHRPRQQSPIRGEHTMHDHPREPDPAHPARASLHALTADSAIVALTVRQPLASVEAGDVPVAPPTYPPARETGAHRFDTPYPVNATRDGVHLCELDSVASQANRMEAAFTAELADVVPRHVVRAGRFERDLTALPHRIADAAIRASALAPRIRAAFEAFDAGDAAPMARIAPTSLVYGAWDSRDTRVRIPRAIASAIRAHDVSVLTRSSVYSGAFAQDALGLDDRAWKRAAGAGLAPAPRIDRAGGILVHGGIVHSASIVLAGLRGCRGERRGRGAPRLPPRARARGARDHRAALPPALGVRARPRGRARVARGDRDGRAHRPSPSTPRPWWASSAPRRARGPPSPGCRSADRPRCTTSTRPWRGRCSRRRARRRRRLRDHGHPSHHRRVARRALPRARVAARAHAALPGARCGRCAECAGCACARSRAPPP